MKQNDFGYIIEEEYDQINEEYMDIDDFKKKIQKETKEQVLSKIRNKNGSGDKIYLKLTSGRLAKLFNINKRTLFNWIKTNRFDPTDLISVIKLYNQLNKDV